MFFEMILSEDSVAVRVHGISKMFGAMNAKCKEKKVGFGFLSDFGKWKK